MIVFFLATCGFLGQPEHLDQVNGKFTIRIPGQFTAIAYEADLSNSACAGHEVPRKMAASILPFPKDSKADCHYDTKVSYDAGLTTIEFSHVHGLYSNVGLLGKFDLICDGNRIHYNLDQDSQEETIYQIDDYRWDFVRTHPLLIFLPDELSSYTQFARLETRPQSYVWIRFRYRIDEESETSVKLRVRQNSTSGDGGFCYLPEQDFPLTRTGGVVQYKTGKREVRRAEWKTFSKKIVLDPKATEAKFSFRSIDDEKPAMMFVEDLTITPNNFREKSP